MEHTGLADQGHGSHVCGRRGNGGSNGGAVKAVDAVELLGDADRRDARRHPHRASHARAPWVQHPVPVTQQHIQVGAQGRARPSSPTAFTAAVTVAPRHTPGRSGLVGSGRQQRQPNVSGVGPEQRHNGRHLAKGQKPWHIRCVDDHVRRAAVQEHPRRPVADREGGHAGGTSRGGKGHVRTAHEAGWIAPVSGRLWRAGMNGRGQKGEEGSRRWGERPWHIIGVDDRGGRCPL